MTVRLQPRPIGDTWRFFLREMSGADGIDLSVYSDISCQIRLASARALFATPTIILADQTDPLTRGMYELRVDAATTETAAKGLYVFDVQLTDSLGTVTTLHVPPIEFEVREDVTKLAADPPVAPPPTFAGDGTRLLMRSPLGVYTSIRIEPTGTRAPLATDDASQGYAPGSWWLYAGDMWRCRVATTGAAVWVVDAVPSDALPLAAGTAAAGTSALYARADHVHPAVAVLQVTQDIAISSGATLSAGDAVALVAGRVERSDARAGSVVAGYIGQCVVGGTGDAGGTVRARVVVAGIAPASGLTAGAAVYLSTSAIGGPGAVSSAVPAGLGALSQRVGWATSTTEFALQIGAPEVIDYCSPLDIPTNGIFYGRASSANLLASGRITTNGIADLFGTGRFATVDGAGNAPLYVADGASGGLPAWQFAASRVDRLRVVHDAGMAGTAWSGFVVHFQTVTGGFRTLVAKTSGGTPTPFDFLTTNDVTINLATENPVPAPAIQRGWRADGFSRPASASGLQSRIYTRGAQAGSTLVGTLTAGANSITIGCQESLSNPYEGLVAVVALWNRALPAAEQVGLAKWARREWLL